MRDTIGIVLVASGGVAAAVCAALLTRPGLGRRVALITGRPPSRRRVALTLLPVVAALLCAAGAMVAPPHFDVALRPDGAVVARSRARLIVMVTNHGLLSGRWTQAVLLDGRAAGQISAVVPAGDAAHLSVPLPAGLSAGAHELEVGGARLRFAALRPPAFSSGGLSVYPTVAALRHRVGLSLSVTNDGEAAGVFPGVLSVDGKRLKAVPLAIRGGATRTWLASFVPRQAGRLHLDVSGTPGRVLVVKPLRPPSGAVLARSDRGFGTLVFHNATADDCLVELTRALNASAAPLLVAYVRARSTCTVSHIGDGARYIYYVRGRLWNRTTGDFLTVTERARFKRPAIFTTSTRTTSYTDWRDWTVHTTRHTRYTQWRVTVKKSWVWGPAGGVVAVASRAFPRR